MAEFQELFLMAGMAGWPSLISFVSLFAIGIALLIAIKNNRKAFLIYFLFSFLPLLLGLIGTIIYFNNFDSNIASIQDVTPEIIEHIKSECWAPLKVGLYLSIPLFILALIGFLKQRIKHN